MSHLRDEADWSGITFRSIDVGAQNAPAKYQLDGYQYKNRGEWQLAVLLTDMGIPFTPDVPFSLEHPTGRQRLFVPDFLFNGSAYVWNGGRRPVLIHGIEAKGKKRCVETDGRRIARFSERAMENVALMRQQRGVGILLLSNSSIKQYASKGRLPLKLFEPPR
jgi:hypothetical protein